MWGMLCLLSPTRSCLVNRHLLFAAFLRRKGRRGGEEGKEEEEDDEEEDEREEEEEDIFKVNPASLPLPSTK